MSSFACSTQHQQIGITLLQELFIVYLQVLHVAFTSLKEICCSGLFALSKTKNLI